MRKVRNCDLFIDVLYYVSSQKEERRKKKEERRKQKEERRKKKEERRKKKESLTMIRGFSWSWLIFQKSFFFHGLIGSLRCS
jgi:hypothetical protein